MYMCECALSLFTQMKVVRPSLIVLLCDWVAGWRPSVTLDKERAGVCVSDFYGTTNTDSSISNGIYLLLGASVV